MDHLISIIKIHFNKLMLFSVAIVIVFLSIPTLLSDTHFLYNLEPYPDGLFYTLSAKNLVENGRLTLDYKNIATHFSQPPLYALILSLGYLIWNSPASFYLINTFLLIGTFIILTKIILDQKISKTSKLFSLLFLVSHGYFYLLLSLPMTENLTLFLFSIGLYFLTKKKFSRYDFIKIGIISIALVLTRLSIVPTALIFILIGFYKILPSLSKKERIASISIFVIGIMTANFSFLIILDKSLFSYFIYFFQESFLSTNQHSFYSGAYVTINLASYLKTLLGYKANFLWFSYPLTSAALLVGIIRNLLVNTKDKLRKVAPLLFIFASIFSLLLTFYLSDSRYILYVIPTLVLIFARTTPKEINKKQLIFYSCLILFQIYSQAPVFKQLIADNILHKSVAWQHEAVKEIDQFASDHPDFELVTALPPHLVAAYSANDFRVYPLSNHQEFLQKKQYIWGDDIDYDNLINFYNAEISNGKEIYITNSYVTHQQSVIDDYENYKKEFNFVLEKEGCLGACNIYKLGNPNL